MIAEIPTTKDIGESATELQWGRDQMIAEISSRDRFHLAVERASMGPRSNDRGNSSPPRDWRPDYRASMGPRSNDRGNAHLLPLAPRRLRRFNGAAIK